MGHRGAPEFQDSFPQIDCLTPVKATLCFVNKDIAKEKEVAGLNFFLSPSSVIDHEKEALAPAILRHKHHRSSELPTTAIRRDAFGGVYGVRRLKGNGLYSGPLPAWMHRVRNIKKDPTGYVLGLQRLEEYEKSARNAQTLRQMGIETDVPESAFLLHEVIYKTRDGVRRLEIAEAFERARLPEEYKDVPFCIRVDSLGINHRLGDYIHAGSLYKQKPWSEEATRVLMVQQAKEFLRLEMELLGREIPDLNDQQRFLEFILRRIARNVATLHKNNGIHGQLSGNSSDLAGQNLTLDGKFVDYDTLEWLPHGEQFEEQRTKDFAKLLESCTAFLSAAVPHEMPDADSGEIIARLLESVREEYKTSYSSS